MRTNIDAKATEAFVTLKYKHNNTRIRGTWNIKVDTGAGANTMPYRLIKEVFHEYHEQEIIKPEPNMTLKNYSGSRIKCRGSITLKVKKSSQREYKEEKFYVVEVKGPGILGLPACQALDIVHLNLDETNHTKQKKTKTNDMEDLKTKNPDCFDRTGNLQGEEKLCNQQEMEKRNEFRIIPRMKKHTDWCPSLKYAVKTESSPKACRTTRRHKDALQKNPHKVPTEILPEEFKSRIKAFHTPLGTKAYTRRRYARRR